jgi:hypothetical protein
MSNVTKLYPANAAENPDNILHHSLGLFKDVLVIGYDEDGEMVATCSRGLVDGGDMLWMIEKFKHNLLAGDYEE